MSRYATGRRYEWLSRDELGKRGWPLVIRAAGSKGPYDLVALSDTGGVLVQVKSGKKYDPMNDILALREAPKPPRFQRELHYWYKGKLIVFDVEERSNCRKPLVDAIPIYTVRQPAHGNT